MKKPDINYEKLRSILEHELNRDVSLEEAVNTGKHLLNVYEILLDYRYQNGIISNGHN